MAMISCPECGNQISTLSPNCIHCGCPINVCPECNAVITGEVSVCGHCGHQFHRVVEAKREEVIQAPPKNCTEVCLSWKERSGICRYWYPFLYMIFEILGLVLLSIAVYSVYIWKEKGTSDDAFAALGALSEYKVVLKKFKVLTTAAVSLSVITLIVKAYLQLSGHTKVKHYAQTNKIDLVKSLDYTLSTSFVNKSKSESKRECINGYLVAKTIVFQNNDVVREKSRRLVIVETVIQLIVLGSYLAWALKNVEIYMQHYVLTTEAFQIEECVPWGEFGFLLLASILLISAIITIIRNKYEKQMISNWVRENLPQHHSVYEKYLASMAKYDSVMFIK